MPRIVTARIATLIMEAHPAGRIRLWTVLLRIDLDINENRGGTDSQNQNQQQLPGPKELTLGVQCPKTQVGKSAAQHNSTSRIL